MSLLLGLDVGTSGVKVLLITVDGDILSSETVSYPLSTLKPGWVEQDPDDWWEATKKAIFKILKNNNIGAGRIKGISFSGQMHSAVFLDAKQEIIRPAILWSDTRTTKQCEEILYKAGGLEELTKHVSNPALEGFTAPKILWLKENEPDNFDKVRKVVMPKDYICYKLTGNIFTEVSDAAGTLLFDVVEKKWSSEILEKLEIPEDILPDVLNSTDICGKVKTAAAEETGLAAGTAVVAGGADNACGAVGSGIIKEGRVMVSIGTSGVVVAQTEAPTPDKQGRIHLFNHAQKNCWYMMGVMLAAGMSYNWLKENLFFNSKDYEELNNWADSIKPGSEGLLFLPYLYGERTPHADAKARGVFFGISGKHDHRHFVRSVMEGVSFGLLDSLELIKEQEIKILDTRLIGGGAQSMVWQQIIADILNKEISILNIEEGPAFGAALIAGVGVGEYENFFEAESKFIKVEKKVSPIESNVEIYRQMHTIYQNLYTSLKNNYTSINNIDY